MDRTPRGRRRDPEERFWSQLITAQLDTWEPTALPATFRPRRAMDAGARRLLPLVAALVLIALLAIVFFTELPRGLVSTVVNLGRDLPSATPSSHPSVTALAPRRSDAAVRSAGAPPGGQPSPQASTQAGPAGGAGPAGLPGGRRPGAPAAPVAPPLQPSLPVAPPPLPSLPPSLPPLPLPSLSPPPLPPPPPVPPLPSPPIP